MVGAGGGRERELEGRGKAVDGARQFGEGIGDGA